MVRGSSIPLSFVSQFSYGIAGAILQQGFLGAGVLDLVG
jgi:hypothetical protein